MPTAKWRPKSLIFIAIALQFVIELQSYTLFYCGDVESNLKSPNRLGLQLLLLWVFIARRRLRIVRNINRVPKRTICAML